MQKYKCTPCICIFAQLESLIILNGRWYFVSGKMYNMSHKPDDWWKKSLSEREDEKTKTETRNTAGWEGAYLKKCHMFVFFYFFLIDETEKQNKQTNKKGLWHLIVLCKLKKQKFIQWMIDFYDLCHASSITPRSVFCILCSPWLISLFADHFLSIFFEVISRLSVW